MDRIDEAYKRIEEFERMAKEVQMSVSDLRSFTELMSSPNCGSLRLFHAIGKEKSATAQCIDDYEYEHINDHNCYKNLCFCIAHLFDLSEERKRQSGLGVIENAMAGYFEPVTHGRFRLNDLLLKMGALEYPVSDNDGYAALTHRRIKKMADKLQTRDEDLALCALNVINWSLGQAYKVEGLESTFCASTCIDVNQAEDLAREYLAIEGKLSLGSKFSEARKNLANRNVKYGQIMYKERI